LAVEFFKKKNYLKSLDYLKKVAEIDPGYKNTSSLLVEAAWGLNLDRQEEKMAEYTLGPGDVIELYVKDNEEMSGEVTIQPGGEFVIPALHEIIMVKDMPARTLQGLIRERLENYVNDPQVQLVVEEYNSKKWYVLGEVRSRGEYAFAKPQLSLLEALYQAGLPEEGSAAMRRLHLIHPSQDRFVCEKVNAYALLYQGDLSQNLTIRPGDIIYVPKTMVAKLSEIINEAISPLSPSSAAMDDIEDLLHKPPLTRYGAGPGQIPE